MDLGLAGKGAFVAGADGGIGSAVCRAFVREGVERLTLSVMKRSDGDQIFEELGQNKDLSLQVVECNLEDPTAPERAVAEGEAHGPIDIVAMCAGAFPMGGLWDVDEDGWALGLNTKLLGSARLIRAAVPAMAERGWGRVVIIAGLRGRLPSNAAVLGGVINVGIANLVSAVAKEVGSNGVTVNSIDPAHVRTPRWDTRIAAMCDSEGISDQEAVDRIRKSAAVKRMTAPDEVADLIAFLASERAGMITGSSIVIDGGSYPGLY